jgi:hypothetical protein
MLGWLIEESYIRHPKVVTAAEIQRRLGVSCKTSLVMKRRMQVFASEQMEKVKTLIWKQMEKEFKDFLLPPDGTDITSIAARKKIVHADTVALWSCSVRANQGRKRWKHGGLTSSIYMSDKLGGRQIGTLVNVMGTQQGWCLLHSIPNQKADTLGPIIKEHLPMSTGIFTDQGYDWLYRVYRNHRMINHSRKSPDNRFRFARDRWSRNGVHNQVSEALNSSLKAEMQAYRYFKPENSTLYLNEWSFFKNLRYFGLAKIADRRLKRKSRCVDSSADISPSFRRPSVPERIKKLRYQCPSLEDRRDSEHGEQNGKVGEDIQTLLGLSSNARLKDALTENDVFWQRGHSQEHQRKQERRYQYLADQLWSKLNLEEWIPINEIATTFSILPRRLFPIVRRWSDLGLAEVTDIAAEKSGNRTFAYHLCRTLDVRLPRILYMRTKQQMRKGGGK